MSLLDICGLTVVYPSKKDMFEAVKEVSFSVRPGEILGIVGESGEGYTLSVNGMGDSWQISPRSKLLPFALYLVRYCRQSQRSQSSWLFPWQVRDKDYRRLARIVFRQGQL